MLRSLKKNLKTILPLIPSIEFPGILPYSKNFDFSILPPANEVTGRQCFHRCLSVHMGYFWSHVLSGEWLSLAPWPFQGWVSLVPGPFQEVGISGVGVGMSRGWVPTSPWT